MALSDCVVRLLTVLSVTVTVAIILCLCLFSSKSYVYQYPSSAVYIRHFCPILTDRVEVKVSGESQIVRSMKIAKSPKVFRETLKFNDTIVVENSHSWSFYFDSSSNITAEVSNTNVLPPGDIPNLLNSHLNDRFELCVLEGKSAYTRWKHHQTGDDIHCTLLETRSSDVLRAFSAKLGGRSSIHHNVINNGIRYVTVRRLDPGDKQYEFSVNVTVERDVVQNTSIVVECRSSWTAPCSFGGGKIGEQVALQITDRDEHRMPALVNVKYHPNKEMYVLFFLGIPIIISVIVEGLYHVLISVRIQDDERSPPLYSRIHKISESSRSALEESQETFPRTRGIFNDEARPLL